MSQTVTVPGVGDLDFPDGMSQPDMAAAIQRNFPQIHSGGAPSAAQPTTAPAAAPAPSLMDSVVGSIKNAAANVADVASGFADSAVHALTAVGQGVEQSDAAATGTPMPPPIAPPPPDIDALSAPFQTPDSQKTPAQLATEKAIASQPPPTNAVGIDQAAARRRAWDDVPQNPVQAGYNEAAGRAGKTLGNAMTTAGEAIDSESLRTTGRQYQAAADARINRAMQGNEDSDTVKTVAGVFSLAPLLAGPAGIGSMVTQAGVDGYADARQAGDSPGEAISRGTAMALANYVGLRVQVPGLTGALTKAVAGAPAGQAVAALGHALTTNVGGMEATTVLGDLYDKMAPGGLKPDMTAADMVSDIADTAKSATLLTLAVPGLPLAAGHLFHAAHSLAHGQGNAEVARAIDGANPPAAGDATTSADNIAAAPPAPNFSAPPGLDTLHNSIDEAARTVGLTPKATAALRDAAAKQDPQDAAAFVARAFHRFEANGLTTKPGAPGAFRDALAQRIVDQQPDEPAAAPAPAAAAKPSPADQLTAIRPLEQSAPAPDAVPAAAEQAPAAEPAPITPTAMAQANDIAAAAHDAATSPFNDRPDPTDAQKAAGNYAMGHVQLHGLDITVENPQGSVRSGVDPDGKPWQNEITGAHYGYIKGTHAADGDHVDTFIGPNPESKTAYVIDQVDPNTGAFDEPKTILGADSEQQARDLYAANYSDGWRGLGSITELPMDAFKSWVKDGVKSRPLGDLSEWKPDERAQPDVAEPSGVPAGAGDGGGGPAVASSGDLGQDAAVAAGRGVGGDAAAPAGGAGAAAAVDAGGGADAALKSTPDIAEVRRRWPGLVNEGDDYVRAVDASRKAEDRLLGQTRSHDAGNRIKDAVIADFGGESKIRQDRSGFQVELTKRLAAESDRIDRDRQTPGTFEHRLEQSRWESQVRDSEAAMHKAAQQEVDDSLSQLRELHAQGRLTDADAHKLMEAHAASNSFDLADALHQIVEGKTVDGVLRNDLQKATAANDEPAPRLLGKSVTDYETPALQKIAGMKTSSARAREVASAEIARRVAQPVEPTSADQAAPVPQVDAALTKQGTDTPHAGIDPAALRSEVTRIQAGWKDAPPVHVVDDVAGLPEHIQDSLRSMGAEGKTRALLMPGKGSDPGDVYLIASRLKDLPTAQQALFHEVLGHYGIRKVLGSDAVYSAEMYKLRQANPALASEAESWMQQHGRGAIADRMSRGLTMDQAMKVVRALSTEEALADRAGRGEPIRGLQSLMAKIQAWLRSVGLHSVADHLESMTQAETAALLARARRAVEVPESGATHGEGTEPVLTSRPVREEGIPEGAQELGGSAKVDELKSHPDYKAAKAGDPDAAVRLVNALVKPEDIEAAKRLGPDVVYAYPHAEESSGRNAIPAMLAHKYAAETGGTVAEPILQSNRVFHTGADAMQRLASRPLFDGPVEAGKRYVVVDDVTTMGSTLAELADHIQSGGGDVVGVATLANASRAPTMVAPKRQTAEIERRYGQTIRDTLQVEPRALTGAEAGYLIGFRNADELGTRIASAARTNAERGRQAGVREEGASGDAPLLSQHASDDGAAAPESPKSHVADALAKVREAGAKFADTMKAIRDDALLKTVPMAIGTPETRTIAKDFANADRLARWQWGKFDDVLKKNYDEAQRRAMWEAGDQESVLRQQGKTPGPKEGLNRLTPDERKTVETLQSYGDGLLKRAQDVGMFQGEGLPSWTPRMAVLVDGSGEFSRPKGGGAETGAKQGRNIVTSASSLKARKYLTAEDTEAAMKGKLGDGAQLVRDIRTMPLAMARLERAIAGRELVNQIKAMGQRAGLETVSKTDEPGFFTVDHPAFKTWQATTDEDGTKSWEAKPLYVNKAFQGPLKAVMSETPGPVYSALMSLKAKSMGLIMYSPLIHNAVEWGRALPAMPGKVATFQIYFEGNRIKNDPEQMRQAINDGLVPIGRRGGIQDITGIMEDPSLKPGRSWTAKLLGGAMGIAEPVSKPAARVAGKAVGAITTPVGKAVQALGAQRLGGVIAKTGKVVEAAGTGEGVKKGVDALGDFWHNTLLWDRVGDLQAGLYGALREKEIQKGTDPAAAGKLAAHFANRFAGALPNEAMSAGARKVANILMFSRTFTLGNMGLMKDMVTGLPRDIQAQIRAVSGDLAAASATSRARRIAIASFIVDIGLMYVANSIVQDVFNRYRGKKTWGEIGQGYADRLHKLLERTGDHPLETLSNPFDVVGSLSSTSENEPGKEDRIRVGTQDDGTAIYMRLPIGKVGEDFKNWITKPLVTAKAKESQLLRPLAQTIGNDNGIGRRIYDPDAKGIGGVLSNAGKIAKLFATQAIPADAIQGALDWKNGKASDVDKLKVAGPLAGLTFSKGAPGGPAVGQMYDADRRFEGAKMDVIPDVKAAIKAGDDDKAIALLEGIKMTPSEIMRTLRHLEMPESRLSAGAFKHFAQHASDDDMERMSDLLGIEKAREAAPATP